jgi:multiple sugar transport system ATP-binding protein
MAEVALEHVTKQYAPGVAAVDDLSLTVADGELVVLVGPSGCGKTTTLRLVAGLEAPTAGLVRIDGRTVNDLPPRSRDVALVFQRPTLYPHLTVRANLAFGARLRRGGLLKRLLGRLLRPGEALAQGRDLDDRVGDAARALGLTELLDRLPGQLSGGQQQRAALGRALVRRPAAFLLDEPLSNLEPGLRHELRRELHLLQRRLRATMLYVTHDQVEAMTLGDRVVVMDRGRVQQADPPAVLYERPVNRFVAGFIGWPPMSFLDGRLTRDDRGEPAFLSEGRLLPLPAELVGAADGREATLGLRPENVVVGDVCKDGPAAPDGARPCRLSMEVLLVESLGATRLVTLRRGGWQLLAQTDGRPAPRERQAVEVVLDMTRAHVFDRASGLALIGGAPG